MRVSHWSESEQCLGVVAVSMCMKALLALSAQCVKHGLPKKVVAFFLAIWLALGRPAWAGAIAALPVAALNLVATMVQEVTPGGVRGVE